jgi:uncharacterized membrane protein YadS
MIERRYRLKHLLINTFLLLCGFAGTSSAQAAVDSYRFAHVTIATPWYIFIFLLMGIFAPFVLMAVLAWRNATRRSAPDATDFDHEPPTK